MPPTNPSRAKRWCFTLNNYTAGEEQILADLLESDHVLYGVYGRERGESNTPHLQGYLIWSDTKSFHQTKQLLGNRFHLEVSRGTPEEASDYCKKEGDYNEYGTCPKSNSNASKKGKWDQLVEYIQSINEEEGPRPSDADLYARFPGLMGPNRRGVLAAVNSLYRPPAREVGRPRDGWQRILVDQLEREPDDRRITFVVDEPGNSGKTWLTKFLLKKYPLGVQSVRVAKLDDMAHSIRVGPRIYIFDVPRGRMEYLQYSILESLKDGYVFSPKYESQMKELPGNVHVVVMCNEEPDMNKLSRDRYHKLYVDHNNY